jgi:orotidine-5'-phosphate decarboxylase
MTIFANPIAVAIDRSDLGEAERLTDALIGHVGCVKIGMEFFHAQGREGYERLARKGVPVFLDLKLHDIPNTVARTLDHLMTLAPRPAVVNVHASGGREMIAAAASAVAGRSKLIAVTVLTSLGDEDLEEMGLGEPRELSMTLARLAKRAGADGVVCSPLETTLIKRELGKDFLAVVPGVRPQSAAIGDQRRVATPRQALAAGADLLVIGRPITGASDPREAAKAIGGELAHGG